MLIKVVLLFFTCLYGITAQRCDPNLCQLPDCRCFSTDIPGNLQPEEVPQIVMFTFDDAVNAVNFEFYRQAFFDKVNPDGCPVGSTYFVSHEYTDYSRVHELHARGQEIALHSISHSTVAGYWENISVEGILSEFGDEKEIISHFANIPSEDISGMRLPFLQMSGDRSFEGLKQIGLTYDASWPTFKQGSWPYSLDYVSSQDCPIGPCPTGTHPGVWVHPMVYWTDDSENVCAMVDACANVPDDADGLLRFMIKNFERNYKGNRSPLGVYLHASWFVSKSNSFEAYLKFIDYLQTLPDVYLVGMKRGLDWVRNPQSIKNLSKVWDACQPLHPIDCNGISCQLPKGDEDRWMTQCLITCPNTYPWLGNPLGN